MAAAPMTTDQVLDLHRSLSNWGRWGPDDEIGALNFITPDVTASAAALVRAGRTVSCSRPLPTQPAPENPVPVAHHMTHTATEGHGADYFAIASHGYATSHIDALCHIFHDDHLYNGYESASVTAHGATKLGIEHLRDGIVTRGVLLDIPRLRGVDALEPGEPIYVDEIEAAERATGTTVRSGDAVLVRTGRWRWRELHGPWNPRERVAGLDASCLRWMHDREISVLGGDATSDVMPSRVPGIRTPIHSVAIVAMGVHLLDNLDLETLGAACADAERWDFLWTVAPLVLNGGTASPVNPIAIL